jgi:hypothetical protein
MGNPFSGEPFVHPHLDGWGSLYRENRKPCQRRSVKPGIFKQVGNPKVSKNETTRM